jgi:hypothetical protein
VHSSAFSGTSPSWALPYTFVSLQNWLSFIIPFHCRWSIGLLNPICKQKKHCTLHDCFFKIACHWVWSVKQQPLLAQCGLFNYNLGFIFDISKSFECTIHVRKPLQEAPSCWRSNRVAMIRSWWQQSHVDSARLEKRIKLCLKILACVLS